MQFVFTVSFCWSLFITSHLAWKHRMFGTWLCEHRSSGSERQEMERRLGGMIWASVTQSDQQTLPRESVVSANQIRLFILSYLPSIWFLLTLRNLALLNCVGLGSEAPNTSLLWQSSTPLCLMTLLQLDDLGGGPTKASDPTFLLV